ncbi:hypothetical protein PALB_10870 [Pseudoalteromonas luteoviolacea B = ATCC 29581]|nr:hypothetical protein PALB_10870 [Pseudoalteromonas luteoviolacea B = ATCC 29581]
MRSFRFVLFLLCTSTVLEAAEPKTIYRWQDENGNWVFSDVPQKGANAIELKHNALNMPPEDTSVLDNTSSQAITQFVASILSPNHEETLRDNNGTVYVSGKIEPRFLPNMQVQLFLDGKAVSERQNNVSFALRDVPRGEHTLQIKLFDGNGELLSTSASSVFFLHRASVTNN